MTLKPGDVQVRGVRQRAPTQVVVGRVSNGFGPVEFITLQDIATALVKTGIINGPANPGSGSGVINVLQAENLDPLQTEEGAFITL